MGDITKAILSWVPFCSRKPNPYDAAIGIPKIKELPIVVPTYHTTASVRSLNHYGTQAEACAWIQTIMGAEVFVIDATGKRRAIGVVEETRSSSWPGRTFG